MKTLIFFILISILINACSNHHERATLADIDIVSNRHKNKSIFIKPKSDNDIRKAYSNYLKHASKDDTSRLAAINRLAELEFELGNKLQKEAEALATSNDSDENDQLYNERLDKTIELLNTSIKDYPDSKGNDKILYQLAKAYDHRSQFENSIATVTTLVNKYPKSPYYIESQFRLAEVAFSKKNYIQAEDTYTDIIGSRKNVIFYEKSLFKRGWARFKQEYYLEAVDDYLEAVNYHNFPEYNGLNPSEREQFGEYFRAIGLAFSYLGGAESLNKYFTENKGSKYIYYTYSHVSDIYLKQSRYSDSVDTLNYFITHNKKSLKIPDAQLKIINIWKKSGFVKKTIAAIADYYNQYKPNSQYWLNNKIAAYQYKNASTAIRENSQISASHYHQEYLKNKKESNFKQAKIWYKRYLKHYSSSARKDNIYYQYAGLLSAKGQFSKALKYHEKAAYDGNIILNKKSAYATILLTKKLVQNKQKTQIMLKKHIKYSILYAQLYPKSKQSSEIILHASELAFKNKKFKKIIELANTLPENIDVNLTKKLQIIMAHAYFNTKQYENAEEAYQSILNNFKLHKSDVNKLKDKLALSIYKQAEREQQQQNIKIAINHYQRISNIVPQSSIAATGLYDGIALAMRNNLWIISINNIKHFQALYPHNKYNRDVTKKLSIAYLRSNQSIKAAKEFEKISSFEKNKEFKIAALWQAAKLYEKKNDIASAIRSYEKYTHSYRKPYPQFMEAMNKLTLLYAITNNNKKVRYWKNKIINEDNKIPNKLKNDRIRFIVSKSSLTLAQNAYQQFSHLKLILPLKTSLRKKKFTMQKAVKLYGQASKYGIAETATESTYSIAKIYQDFSQSLLKSERPKNLNRDEREQYDILLEDKAFPFEEKAIEFYEINLAHIKDGVYNQWIEKSLSKLKKLFPARYNRTAKLDGTVDALH